MAIVGTCDFDVGCYVSCSNDGSS